MRDLVRWLPLFSSLVLASPGAHAEKQPGPASARTPHPEPRVIVHVLEVLGPHPRTAVERAARQGWGRIVRCYKAIDRRARGLVAVEFRVTSNGRVTGVRRTRSTLKSHELATCLTDTLKALPMPEASAGSIARAEIRVAPGDPE